MKWAHLVAVLLSACPKGAEPSKERASLRRVGGTTFEIVPAPAQLPYCLAFTHAQNGTTRQLTMSRDNLSPSCPEGQPLAGRVFRVPLAEGAVKVLILFSSEKVNAASVAQQLLERDLNQLSVMDLRLPGNATLEKLEFAPQNDVDPTEGQVLGGADDGGSH